MAAACDQRTGLMLRILLLRRYTETVRAMALGVQCVQLPLLLHRMLPARLSRVLLAKAADLRVSALADLWRCQSSGASSLMDATTYGGRKSIQLATRF